MTVRALSAFAAATLALAPLAAEASPLYSQNFEGLADGQTNFTGTGIAVTNTGTGANGTRLVEVDDDTTNKSGNLALRVLDNDTVTTSDPFVSVTLPTALTSGVISFKIWGATFPPNTGEYAIQLHGQLNGAAPGLTEASRLYFRTDTPVTRLRVRHGTGTGSNNADTNLADPAAANTAYDISIAFDAVADTYSVQVNGGTAVSGRFVGNRDMDNISRLGFAFLGGTTGVRVGEYFIDDIAVVPEPASLALLAVGGALIASRRRG